MTKYYTTHSNAHNDLDKVCEPMSDRMKINNFCNGLKDLTAINYVIPSKTEPGVITFEDFYNSFSAKLTSHLTLVNVSSSSSNRSINTVSHGGRGRGGDRGRGRVHCCGHYNPYHRGGHGGRGHRRGGHGGRDGFSSSASSYWTPEIEIILMRSCKPLSGGRGKGLATYAVQ